MMETIEKDPKQVRNKILEGAVNFQCCEVYMVPAVHPVVHDVLLEL
jgi:hypothetical protein